jgi:hypothetical protein
MRVVSQGRHEQVIPMFHLEDRLAEFVFDELPPDELNSLRQHLAQCLDCQTRVSDFQKVQHSLEQLPDEDLPRRMVFVPEMAAVERRTSWFSFAWAVPSAAVAVLALAMLIAGPFQFEWSQSGVQIAFGSLPQDSAPQAEFETVAVATPSIDYDNLDYAQIAARLAPDQQLLMAAEFEQRNSEIARLIDQNDQANRTEIRRVRADMGQLYDMQRMAQYDFYDQGSTLQLMAQLTEGLGQ